MPWTTDADVERHNKGLNAKQKRVWREVANQELSKHGDDARAIKSANAAVAGIKESAMPMTHNEIDTLFQEASKVLNLDSSHDAIRQKVQAAISAKHRMDNAGNESGSYYDTPYVRDVFGSEDAGQVVHSKDGKMTLSNYKKSKDGASYELSNHKSVKHAYVVTNDNDADDKKESMTLVLDGREVVVEEAATHFTETSELMEFQESAKSGTAKITLITAGKGSMGYYTESALKKAAQEKKFDTGTQMFLNHQTKEERLARPEGDITKLTGKLTAPAEYVEGVGGKPGRLVAPATVYARHKDFLLDAKDDIGVSVRVTAIPTGTKDGVPLVESISGVISADFVTKAGRGGKIEEMYESYRATHPGRGNQPQENEGMTEQETKALKDLQESNATLATRLDRVQEQNTRLLAESRLNTALPESKLHPRGQNRVRTTVLANLPLKDGVLDTAKFDEAVKAAITDEVAYLQESGVQVGPKLVRGLGVVPTTGVDGKELSEAEVENQANTIFEESVNSILGKEKTAKVAV